MKDVLRVVAILSALIAVLVSYPLQAVAEGTAQAVSQAVSPAASNEGPSSLRVTITPVGITEDQASLLTQLITESPAVQKKIGIHRHRLLNVHFDEADKVNAAKENAL